MTVLLSKIDNVFLPKHRAYKLQDGDIFTVNETTIEHSQGEFYEVIPKYCFEKNINMIVRMYSRTGKTFTIQELESLT